MMISVWLFEVVLGAVAVSRLGKARMAGADFKLSRAEMVGAGNCAADALVLPTVSPGSLACSPTKPHHISVAIPKIDKSNKDKHVTATVLMFGLE